MKNSATQSTSQLGASELSPVLCLSEHDLENDTIMYRTAVEEDMTPANLVEDSLPLHQLNAKGASEAGQAAKDGCSELQFS